MQLNDRIEELSINTLRFLAVDAIQKANSGHPGMPMACAPIAYLLYHKIMRHNPGNPTWINRDRFVLSAGHGSMLLYGILHLSGYELSLDDIKNFRQWGSITPGHPEYSKTPGVETTTGPLGQGFANAVGMAAAKAYLAGQFNTEEFSVFDNYIYVIASDGDLMEGISHEAASFAGHQKLSSLIVFYDNNKITIDGSTDLSMSENVGQRFEAYGWHIEHVDDVNDLIKLEAAVVKARNEKNKPSLIIVDTHIGFGSPNKQDSEKSHGAPLGEEEVKLTKLNLNWPTDPSFFVPVEVYTHFEEIKSKGAERESVWNRLLRDYKSAHPDLGVLFDKIFGSPSEDWKKDLPVFTDYNEKIATRSASGKIINYLAEYLPNFIGGSADLTDSNNTRQKNGKAFSAENRKGRNIHFGIREHAMGGILNGMALYGGLIPYGGTFLIFSDYLRPSIRLAALSKIRPIYVFSHDSIGLGEDGPTHQPVEQMASLRAVPDLIVIRPADANETAYAWRAALETEDKPVALILTRQKLPLINRDVFPSASGLLKGAYIIKDNGGNPDLILIASGSEVHLALNTAEALENKGLNIRVVNMASWQLFESQSPDYKESVLIPGVKARVSIEAGIKQGWEKYVGEKGISVSIETYGASAPEDVLFENFGFTVGNIIRKCEWLLENTK